MAHADKTDLVVSDSGFINYILLALLPMCGSASLRWPNLLGEVGCGYGLLTEKMSKKAKDLNRPKLVSILTPLSPTHCPRDCCMS